MSSKISSQSSLKTVWRNVAVAVFAVVFALLGLCVTLIPTHAADDGNYTVGEIYGQHTNVQQLYNLITGKTNATYDDVVAAATTVTNSATMRNYNDGNDIKVTFGGKEWYAVYLSRTMDGRPMLTLWLCEPFTTAQWNSFFLGSKYYVYPSDMYGTSYVRTKILNNAGRYSTDDGNTLNEPVTVDANHTMAKFSVDDVTGSVTDVIVKPSVVEWQRAGQKNSGQNSASNCKNENWGEDPKDTWLTYYYINNGQPVMDPYSNDYSRVDALKDVYGAWADDYLWLPSNYELAVDWQFIDGHGFMSAPYWIRSGACNYHGYIGSLTSSNNGNRVTQEREIRPALHIDLSATALLADWPQGEPSDVTFAYTANAQTIAGMTTKPGWYDSAMTITYRNQNGETVSAVKDAGTYTATVQLNDMTKDITVTVTKQAVTVEGLKAKDKTYDGTQKVDFDTSGVKLTGSYTIDDVSIIPDGKYPDKNVGEKSVPVTISLTGKDADNYVLTNPELTLTANITPRTVTIKNIATKDKTYDSTPTAFLDTSKIDYTNIVAGDDLTVAVTGTFTQVTVGTDIPVTLDIKLVGDDAANYKIDLENSQQDTTGNITKRFITVTINDQTVKVGDAVNLTARVTSGSLANGDNADDVYTLAIKPTDTETEFDVNNLPAGEYEITGQGINDNYDVKIVNGKYTVLTAAAWDALQTKDDESKGDNNAWLVIIIVIAVAAFIGALVGIGLVLRSHDRAPKPVKEKRTKQNKKKQTTVGDGGDVTPKN